MTFGRLRKHAKDGPFSLAPESADLLAASLSRTRVESDSSGNLRLIKQDRGSNTARDDVSAALVLGSRGIRAVSRRP